MYCRFILPIWAQKEFPNLPTVVEGQFNHEETLVYNARGYNSYYLPNHPSGNISGRPISGKDIDRSTMSLSTATSKMESTPPKPNSSTP